MTAGTDEGRRTPPLIAAAFGLIIVLLLVSIGLQAGVINPTAQSNQTALNSQGAEIRAVACALAESSANAARVRTEDPETGKLETIDHFRTRMLAQRHTLLAAAGIGCTSAKGFPPFEKQIRKALREIRAILFPKATKHHGVSRATSATEPADLPVAASSEGGGANTSPSTGPSPAGPHGGSGGGHGGIHGPGPGKPPAGGPAPTEDEQESGAGGASPTASSPGSTSSSTSERTTESTVVESAPAPVREGVGGVVEGVGKTVEETGAAVNGTIEGVTEVPCSLAKVLC